MRERAAMIGLLLLVSCGSGPMGSVDDAPPNLVVTAGAEQLVVRPYAYCWRSAFAGVCADGAPAEPLPVLEIAADNDLVLSYPLEWEMRVDIAWDDGLTATHRLVADADGEPVPDLEGSGSARVEVFARGGPSLDAAFAFAIDVEGPG